HVMRQMMQHHGAQDDVEGSILKGKSLRGGRLEIHLDAVLPGLLFRTADHLRGGIDSCGLAEVSDAILCLTGHASSGASHIYSRFPLGKAREVQRFLSEGALAAEQQHPHEKIVAPGPVDDSAAFAGSITLH